MSADKRIADILAKYGEDPREATWRVQSATVIYHKALERIAAQAQIRFDPPTILRAERDEAVILVVGHMGERTEWSIGEAVINVNYRVSGKQAAYVWAMAEKRAKDRVILKLIELHGLVYSEEEADDFKAGAEPTVERISSAEAKRQDVWRVLTAEMDACQSPEALKQWGIKNRSRIGSLKDEWQQQVRDYYADRMETLSKPVVVWPAEPDGLDELINGEAAS